MRYGGDARPCASIASVSALAASNSIYLAAATPHYKHHVTGVIEDAGGDGSAVLGRSMTESATCKQALVEVDPQGNTYVTIRLRLMDNIKKPQFQVDGKAVTATLMQENYGSMSAEIHRAAWRKVRPQSEAAEMLWEFDAFMESYKDTDTGKENPKVLVLMGLPGSYIVTTESGYVGNLVKLAGGVNVYGDGDGEEFLNANTENIQQKNQDIILRAAHALPDDVKAMFAKEFAENDIWKHF